MLVRYTRKELAEGNLKKKRTSASNKSSDVESLAKIVKKIRKEK